MVTKTLVLDMVKTLTINTNEKNRRGVGEHSPLKIILESGCSIQQYTYTTSQLNFFHGNSNLAQDERWYHTLIKYTSKFNEKWNFHELLIRNVSPRGPKEQYITIKINEPNDIEHKLHMLS